ncbi:taurine dioxygenase [Acinetobacter populi]|uniref:Taurine dioxygenase n=1 Tax=Acinetobacter populi TaxID=1582270 RepID=A0A1Z9YWZ8_9GAMM|nr:taurine dioxygenase [Acinetobacter populi]OUY06736.1 taurine dioxygenase [Acinetobacter populi]
MSSIGYLNIEKIKPAIGAIIHGIDLNDIDQYTLEHIKQALLDHQVIFFRQQKLSSASQATLARSFGQLHVHPVYPSVENTPEIMVLDSLQQDLRDNELWHTDVTFSETPPLGCVLQAIKIPEFGGDTLWSSSTAAFEQLEFDLQQQLFHLTATHDIRKSFPLERFAKTAEQRKKLEQVFEKNPHITHPVVVNHPETKKPILFVNEGFTTQINELDAENSEALLRFLFQHATQEEISLRWKWQVGDVAIWDNRCTQHKALFDYGDAHRIMHRATIVGQRPTRDKLYLDTV